MKKTVLSSLIIFFIATAFFSSCQKAISDQNVQYIGAWGSDKFAFEIWKNGLGMFQRKNQEMIQCRVIIEDNSLKFRGGVYKTFEITADPATDVNGNTVLMLDNEPYYKH